MSTVPILIARVSTTGAAAGEVDERQNAALERGRRVEPRVDEGHGDTGTIHASVRLESHRLQHRARGQRSVGQETHAALGRGRRHDDIFRAAFRGGTATHGLDLGGGEFHRQRVERLLIVGHRDAFAEELLF
jgi:hypothetical protein